MVNNREPKVHHWMSKKRRVYFRVDRDKPLYSVREMDFPLLQAHVDLSGLDDSAFKNFDVRAIKGLPSAVTYYEVKTLKVVKDDT